MFEKPPRVHGRESEWKLLQRTLDSDRPELVLVVGRRRVGKSHLLAPFAQLARGIYYQATRRAEDEQLRTLTRLIGQRFDDPALVHGQPFDDWMGLLRYLSARATDVPLMLVLDEFTYLAEVAPGLPSVLQSWWDHDVPGTAVKLVLSGSYVSAMKRLEATDAPLHGRRTHRLALQPFTAQEVAALCAPWSCRDRLIAYGIFGGLPGNVCALDPSHDLASNVVRHVLDPSARLFDEAQHVLDGFRSDRGVHHAILAAVADGAGTWKALTSRTAKSAGSISRPLDWLLEMELVHRRVPVTERDAARSRRAVYRVADPYLSFWHRFLRPLHQAGLPATLTPEELWQHHVAPGLDDHMGLVFEEIASAAVAGGTLSLPFRPLRVGAWWDTGNQRELDIVALSLEGGVLAAGCKWGTVDDRDVRRLQERAAYLLREIDRPGRLELALFAGRGLADERAREAADHAGVRVIEAAELVPGGT